MKISLRLFSLFLAVLICLALLPVGIMANEESGEEISVLTSETVTVSGTASSSDADATPTPAPTATPAASDSASSSDANAALQFTVTYDANGGSGAPSAQTKTEGTTLTLSSTKPTRSSYTFQGWSTVKNGTVEYKAGGSYTADASVTLYAVWGYAVSFDANGGSGAPSSRTKLVGQSFTIPSTKPTRSGYTFQGWSTTKNGTVKYKAGSTYSSLASSKLYAVWGYTVSFDANGGSGAPSSRTKLVGQSFTIPSTKPTRSGYTFQGWSTTKNGTVKYKAGSTYTSLASSKLYAVWGYTVSFDANGGSGAPSSRTKLVGQSFTIPSTKPTRSGYTFQGWSTTKNGTVKYKAGSTYSSLASSKLYAVWTQNTGYAGPTTAGWHQYNGYWYYVGSNGKPLTSQWLKSGGYWYYLKADGRMAASETLTISGVKYTFNSSGRWVS